MKRLIIMAFTALLLHCLPVNAQLNFIGFSDTVCGAPVNHVYTYTNTGVGAGSSAAVYVNVYRDNQLIYTSGGQIYYGYGKTGKDLVFINDSVGFLVYYSSNGGTFVAKTNDYGVTWNNFANTGTDYLALYPRNEFNVIFVGEAFSPVQLGIFNCSEMVGESTILFWDSLYNSDLFKTDTIIGQPLCNTDSINVLVQHGIDTIVYHLNWQSIPYTGIKDQSDGNKNIHVFPNPASHYFQFDGADDVSEIKLVDLNGKTVKEYDLSPSSHFKYFTDDVPEGFYILHIGAHGRFYHKKLFVLRP